ncbi:ABC transporter substrate-binding protein [Acrocarpospora pleiomorpha]|uniref:ABC transporter substrate-binding protein n=1 Tax=Acrocarpospora pleiomorpha TaxID=90975 RepID=A0A5M3XBL3_9ACTN|nr:ABC transporter substrate-binding protein [Acrocarpospora pleiomorpha]GES19087.1 ABC transporter substrate-binding protein [Acrocarpospora pleiomorpha]
MPSRPPTRAIATAMAAVLALSSCGGGTGTNAGASTGKTEIRFGGTVMSTFDPALSGVYQQSFLTPVYESLLTRDAAGELVPGLATEWKLSEDGKTFDVTLRDGVKFQDGAPLDADAVKRSIERGKNLPKSLVKGQLAVVTSVEAVDATHVRFHLDGPPGSIGNILASEAGMIISPQAVDNPDLATKPVGTGAYTLVSKTDSEVVYKAWDGYWNKDAVKNSGIRYVQQQDSSARFRALASGQLDLIGMDGSQMAEAQSAGLNVVQGASTNLVGILLNPKAVPEFADPLVRQAIMRVIDRKAIADNSGFTGACTPSAQPFPEGYWAHVDGLETDPGLSYDVAAAKDLLAKAGKADGFSFTLSTIAFPAFSSLAQILQAQLAQIGVKVKINVMDTSAYIVARGAGNLEAGLGQYATGRPDPSAFLQTMYLPDGMYNWGKVDYPGAADLLKKSLASTDTAERSVPTHELINLVTKTGPNLVPICALRQTFGTSTAVEGFGTTLLQEYDWRGISIKK